MAKTSRKQFTETIDKLDYVLNFQRHEFKYFLPRNRIEAIIPDLKLSLALDPYCKDGYYGIYSIYYDTEDWQAYYEKLDGIERRKKFRIRTYAPDPGPNTPVMLEIKEKTKDIILKRRTPIALEDIPKLENGTLTRKNDDVFDEWRYNLLRNGLKAKVLIAYERLAFVPHNHGDIRITIDRNVRQARVNTGTRFNAALRATQFAKDHTVLEIKFDKYPPKFAIDLIRKYNLRNEAISKYTESVITGYKMLLKH